MGKVSSDSISISSIGSVTPGTGAQELGKAEDAAHSSGDVGVMGLTVRQDTASALGGADGDYQPLITDDNGRLHVIDPNTATLAGAVSGSEMQVDVVTTVLPTGASTATNQSTIIGHIDGIETLLGTIDSDTSAIAGAISGSEMQVDVVGSLPAGTGIIGKVYITDGTDDAAIDSFGNLSTIASGNIGHDAVDSGNPLKIGGKASSSEPTAVASGDRVDAYFDVNGRLQVVDQNSAAILADTASMDTNLGTLAGAVSGSEVQVDVVGSLPAGTNNIGDVDVATQPARDRATDNQGVALQTDAIMNDTTVLTPQYAVIDDATSGNNTLVAAVASKKIRVLALFLVAADAVNVRFEDGAGGTALTGQMTLAANGGFVLPFNPVGWFETSANTLLNLELSGAISVDGSLTYVEV